MTIKRGLSSFNYLLVFAGFLLSCGIPIISYLPICDPGKIIITLIFSVSTFYICFISNWFRNKIIGLMSRLQDKPEIH